MYKNLPVVNLPNEANGLILETDPNNEIGVLYSKSKKEKSSANIAIEFLIKHHAIIPRWKKKF